MSISPIVWIEIIGYIGVGLTVATYSMRRMIPLRVVGICANVFFILYGLLAEVYPQLVLHGILLPLNMWRLLEMQRLTKRVASAVRGDLSMHWLKPFMTRRKVLKGDLIFRQGDSATEMYFTLSGRYRLPELEMEIGEGHLIGEIGMVAPEQKRMCSFECIQEGEMLSIQYSRVLELYFQNPSFGYYLLQLISRRLFERIKTLEDETGQVPIIVSNCAPQGGIT